MHLLTKGHRCHTAVSLKSLFNQLLKTDLEDLVMGSTLLQYVDDILICAPTLEQCHKDSIKVLTKLAEGGLGNEVAVLSSTSRVFRKNNCV